MQIVAKLKNSLGKLQRSDSFFTNCHSETVNKLNNFRAVFNVEDTREVSSL